MVITTMVIRPLDDRTYCGRSAFTDLGALAKAARLFIASLHSQLMSFQMCHIGIFIDLQTVRWNLKGDFSTPTPVCGYWYVEIDDRPIRWLARGFSTYGLSLTVLRAGSKSVSVRPSDSNTMTITALLLCRSSGKNSLRSRYTNTAQFW